MKAKLYKKASVSDVKQIKTLVEDYVTMTPTDERSVQGCVDFVMNSQPERVDGYLIRPLLKAAIIEWNATQPVEEPIF